jgi:uncharacterized membrane protein
MVDSGTAFMSLAPSGAQVPVWWMLRRMKHKLVRNNDVHPHRGFNKWLALLITNGVGNMWFFYVLIVFIGGWMLLSKLGLLNFDPYPFALMLLIVGGIFQALAMVAIMVGQNVQAAASDARAETDHETLEAIHTLAAQSIQILEGQNKILVLLQGHAKNS